MADNSPQSFSTLTTKQKVVGIVTLAIMIFIVYEIYGLFTGGSNAVKTDITPTPTQTNKPMTATGASPGAGAPNATMQQPTPVAAMPAQANTLTPVSALPSPQRDGAEIQKQQQQQQQTYLDSVNQLQLLKVKREIAETNQAIATSRLATETANKSMTDLLTQPAAPQVPVGAYANKLATGAEVTPTPAPRQQEEISFVVISVSMEFNHWSAVLGNQGKLYNVAIGDTLLDGSTVASISKTGVVLLKDGKKRKVSIQTSI